MPRPRPGQNGQNGPKRPDPMPAPVDPPIQASDLTARLNDLAGGSIAGLVPSEKLIVDFNTVFTNATHQRFEHRALVGFVINAMRPAHGEVTAFNARIAERIGRGVRWVRDTANVAESIGAAIKQGVTLPLEIREVYWRKVPSAVDNIRHGRALDFVPKKEKVVPTPEERAQAVAQAIQALTKALEAIPSPTQRATLATEAIAALEPLTEIEPNDSPAAPEPSPEPPVPSPEPEPEPEPGEPSRPRRPGRRPRRRR